MMNDTQESATQERSERFRSIYLAHYQQVYMYFRRRTDIESARDGTADTFLVAWRRFDQMPTGDRTLAWLYGTARRVMANQWRSRNRSDRLRDRLGGLGRATELSPEDRVIPESHAQQVRDAMSRLSATDSELLRLAEWEDLSHREIAVVLGCSAHAVDQRMHRARRRLAGHLGVDLGPAGLATAEGGAS